MCGSSATLGESLERSTGMMRKSKVIKDSEFDADSVMVGLARYDRVS